MVTNNCVITHARVYWYSDRDRRLSCCSHVRLRSGGAPAIIGAQAHFWLYEQRATRTLYTMDYHPPPKKASCWTVEGYR